MQFNNIETLSYVQYDSVSRRRPRHFDTHPKASSTTESTIVMKATELRQKDGKELNTLLMDLLREQFNLRMQKGSGQLTKPGRIKLVRREIARIKTILQEKMAVESS